jgi:hypothetical protein
MKDTYRSAGFFAAVVAVGAGALQAASDAPLICSPREACAPPPISLGDEPARNDRPLGPTGPVGATVGASLTGATGASGIYRA